MTTRPSCTATARAFGSPRTSTSRGPVDVVLTVVAAVVGDGAAEEPGVVAEPVGAEAEVAVAPAVALEDGGSWAVAAGEIEGAPQPMRLPVTGGRPSMRPVNVAITWSGYAAINFARSSTELT